MRNHSVMTRREFLMDSVVVGASALYPLSLTPMAIVGEPVAIKAMRKFVRQCAEIIHSFSAHKVTVGSARRMWLPYWKGLGVDLYQFHWYDEFIDEEPFPWLPYSDLRLDKPCIVGEVPTRSTLFSTAQYLNAAHLGGYHGLLLWSYRAGDDFSDLQSEKPALEQWCASP